MPPRGYVLQDLFPPFDTVRGLQEQLREKLLDAIFEGALPAHEPMPSSRRLSEALGISRNTVVIVYEKLAHEGYLIASNRRGYYINEKYLREQLNARLKAAPHKLFERPTEAPDWEARLAQHPSRLRAIVKPRNWREYQYPFVYGQFDPTLFPTAEWRECNRMALAVLEIRNWAADMVDRDDPLLIEQIQARLLPRRGIFVVRKSATTAQTLERYWWIA